VPLNFDNSFARQLAGAYVAVNPTAAPRPRELFFNRRLAQELQPELIDWPVDRREAVWAGNELPEGAMPIAQVYAGHQFGRFSPQLGDGRALLLGELVDGHGVRCDVAFKGSGRTPFSRGGDGKAAVGPMLREVLISESLHAMGIPTTQALAVVATGDWVHRERTLPGAVLTRVAHSHLRVGTFEFFAARGEVPMLQRLVDYALTRHPPEPQTTGDDPALTLLKSVVKRQARLVAQWMGVGFIHGVMNTDNMTISGQSIDFGPCAFMEAHDPGTVYSSIDHHGRYAYGNQVAIAQWNLARLAEALLPVLDGSDEEKLQRATAAVDAFEVEFASAMEAVWARKLGWRLAGAGQGVALASKLAASASDSPEAQAVRSCATALQNLMQAHRVDHTLGWRRLRDAASGDEDRWLDLFGAGRDAARTWLAEWRRAAQSLGGEVCPEQLRTANPFVIPRNHLVERALEAASDAADLGPFKQLLAALTCPWDEDDALHAYGEPAPPDVAADHRTFCGT
jgi:uncharacterized protein YdiU (UPF0061 family)